ncbi:MAG: hypothetical protein M1598_08010 [Actinobacteria bacterium]|nr:hypothetical protein [Actinomycetota bacterium]
MTSTPQYVLDSHAVLAWLQGEPGSETVTDLLQQAKRDEVTLSMTVVNLGEVLDIILARGISPGRPGSPRDHRQPPSQAGGCFRRADVTSSPLQGEVSGDPELRNQQEVELSWIGPS